MADDQKTIDGIPIRSEQLGFAAAEMVACGKCAKSNPPNRLSCFYCGEALELPTGIAEGLQFKPSEIEDWEHGITLAIVDGVDRVDPEALSGSLPIDVDLARSLLTLDPPVPLFRVKNEEADKVDARLSRLGARIVRIDDALLATSKAPIRLKGITFGNGSVRFHQFNSENTASFDHDDIALIVTGAVVTTNTESKLKKTRKETKEVDEHLSSSDHAVIDIFTKLDDIGFRILPHGFDFSCLGSSKSLLAAENVKLLIRELRERMPAAIFDFSYPGKRPVLDRVWPPTVSNVSKGIERNWFGVRRSTGTLTSNEEQFTRYSRMRRKLL